VIGDSAMALKRVKANLDRVLDKNMQDLVRGIRNHKDEEVNSRSQTTPLSVESVTVSESLSVSLSHSARLCLRVSPVDQWLPQSDYESTLVYANYPSLVYSP